MGRLRHEPKVAEPAAILIPKLLNEAQHSQGCHLRAIKELCVCRGNGADEFLEVWVCSLRPLFLMSKREPAVHRVVSFVSSFIAHWDEDISRDCEGFFESFLMVLLDWTASKDKTVRFRSCQIISEAVAKLESHFTVKEELWDRMTSVMQERMQDKMTAVRVLASSALARLIIADDIQNDPTVHAYRKALASDPSAEVRRMVVKSMPAANATVADVVQRTADVSDHVRKAAYQTIAERLCISGLSITQRATTLERGLAERIPSVRAECEKLLDLWLREDCDGDPLILLRYLDVETYERVAEMALTELLNQSLIKPPSDGLRQYLDDTGRTMSAEEALFWRLYGTHIRSEAQTKGSEAASMGGAEAVVQAAVAADHNDYFESILPSTVADFVHIVDRHLHRGSAHWFAARQLLILATQMDFTDVTSRNEAGSLVSRLLKDTAPSDEQEEISDDNDSEEWVGDGLNLGGEESWAKAVADFARHVYAASGELEGVIAKVVAEVGGPCREGAADTRQWLHCLAVTGLLLQTISHLDVLNGSSIEPYEIAHSLLLPAAKHLHPEVQRAGIRCLGMLCALEVNLSPITVGQLFLSLQNGRPQIQKIALKAIFDLILCRGARAVESALCKTSETTDSQTDPSQLLGHPSETNAKSAHHCPDNASSHCVPMLEPLLHWLDDELASTSGEQEAEFFRCMSDIAAEGFAKVLLQNRRFPEILSLQERILEELLILYFRDKGTHSPRLEQCLSVFFRVWCSLSADNKRCISKVFIPVIRKKWPGVSDYRERQGTVLLARKHATEVARFMIHLLHLQAFPTSTERFSSSVVTPEVEKANDDNGLSPQVIIDKDVDEGHEALAIRICVEIMSFTTNFNSLPMAHRTYSLMLCRVMASINFCASQQDKIKALLHILPRVIDWIPLGEKLVLKVLTGTVTRLKEMDQNPDAGLSDEELQQFMENMGLQDSLNTDMSTEDLTMSVPRCTAKTRDASKLNWHTFSPEEIHSLNGGKGAALITQGARSIQRQSAATDTFVPSSTRSLRKTTEVQKLHSQTARNRPSTSNPTVRGLSSASKAEHSKDGVIRESSTEEESENSLSSESDSDFE